MSDKSSRYLERCKIARQAMAFEKPDKVPYLGNYWTWKFTDAGYSIEQGARDYGIVEKADRHFLDNYPIDILVNDGLRNPMRVSDVLGATGYQSTEDAGLIVKDQVIFENEDYDALIENYSKAFWERGVMRKCAKVKDMTPAQFAEAGKEFAQIVEVEKHLLDMIENEYGTPCTHNWAFGGYEFLFNWFRGIKGISLDVRKDPDKVKALIEILDSAAIDLSVKGIMDGPDGPDDTMAFDVVSAWLGHTILNPKQFGEFYWPSYKKLLDAAIAKHKTIYNFSEGNWLRFGDYLKDVPKGVLAMHVELDDICEVRKKMPNICLVGGLDVSVMGGGTPKECVEMAKRVIDETGGLEGGLILSENKMCSYPADSKGENIKAVAEFLEDYR